MIISVVCEHTIYLENSIKRHKDGLSLLTFTHLADILDTTR